MTRIVLTGGDTAGHTSPLIATAQALAELDSDVETTCIGTNKRLGTRMIPQAGLELELIRPAPMSRKPNLDLAKLPWNLRRSACQTRTILSRARARALISFDGYVAAPVYLTARTMKAPILVREVNLVVGIANKVAARFATFTDYTFPDAQVRGGERTGMSMNRSITRPGVTRAEAGKRFGLGPGRPTPFVSGGSQGAQAASQALSAAAPAILDAGIQVLHVLGAKNFTDADVVIESGNGACYIPMAYIGAMTEAYMAANLMIGRAGVGTAMETAVLGLLVIFISLPWGNGEQARNAMGLVADGVDILLPEAELSADKPSDLVIPTIMDAEKLAHMTRLVRPHLLADAADVLARAAVDVIQGEETS